MVSVFCSTAFILKYNHSYNINNNIITIISRTKCKFKLCTQKNLYSYIGTVNCHINLKIIYVDTCIINTNYNTLKTFADIIYLTNWINITENFHFHLITGGFLQAMNLIERTNKVGGTCVRAHAYTHNLKLLNYLADIDNHSLTHSRSPLFFLNYLY